MDNRNNLKKLRKERNLTLEELAERTKISKTYLRELETGNKRLNEDNIRVLAEFFNVTYDYLLGRITTELIGKNYHLSEIDKLQSNHKFKSELEKKVMYLITTLKDDDLKTIEALTKHLITKGDAESEKSINQYLDKFTK